jgi:hypothetical protein
LIRIEAGGTLVFTGDATVTTNPIALSVSAIIVEGTVTGNPESSGRSVTPGTLVIGTAQCPIGGANSPSNVTLTFWDNATAANQEPLVRSLNADDFAPCGPNITAQHSGHCESDFGRKVLAVGRGGVLSMYGAHGLATGGTPPQAPSWTYLSAPAGPAPAPSATTLQLANAVDWVANDWIVVATTDFTSHHTEFVQIATVTNGGITLTLQQPLQYYHFGGKADLSDNFGVEERAEVGLLTRSIKLTSNVTQGDSNPYKAFGGGHLMIQRYFSGVVIQGVEFEKFGQGGQIGRYPIHFHLTRDTPKIIATPVVVNSSSIHHSFTRCVTIHATNGVTIQNNVCARTIGHSYFLEDGLEWDNQFLGNLAAGSMLANFQPTPPTNSTKDFFFGDNLAKQTGYGYNGINVPNILPSDNLTPTGFWIRSPDNTFAGNSVAGCHGFGKGFWYVTSQCASGFSRDWFPTESLNYFPFLTQLGTFSQNRAHGCYVGLDTSTEDTLAAEIGTSYCSPTSVSPPKCPLPPDTLPAGVACNNFQNYAPRGLCTTENGQQTCLFTHTASGTTTHVTTMDELVNVTLNPPNFTTETATPPDQCKIRMDGQAVSSDDCFGSHLTNLTQGVIAYWDSPTVTRNRRRGIWVRPSWNNIYNARIATNKQGATLVSSGSADGSPPGIWGAITDSLFVGRTNNQSEPFGDFGCDTYNVCTNEGGASRSGEGYPTPKNNLFGFMFYDGPARLERNTFKNFRLVPEFSQDVITSIIIDQFKGRYSGDAAMGWFPGNSQTFPLTQYTLGNTWENVDFRHMIYTARTGLFQNGAILDGDLNTVIQDRDGTLTGKQVATTVEGQTTNFPYVLNNIPFNQAPNTVTECYSAGNLDTVGEATDRQGIPLPSGLVSPNLHATLVVNYLDATGTLTGNKYFPIADGQKTPGVAFNAGNTALNGVTFLKDQEPCYAPNPPAGCPANLDLKTEIQYQSPTQDARGRFVPPSPDSIVTPIVPPNGSAGYGTGSPQLGLYMQGRKNRTSLQASNFEPKIMNGLGYTMHFPNYGAPQGASFSLMDAELPKDITPGKNAPFKVRVGVCYKGFAKSGGSSFEIRQGTFGWGQPYFSPQDMTTKDALPWTQCPNSSTSGQPITSCPANLSAPFTQVGSIGALDGSSCSKSNCYYFDSTTGLVFFYVEQTEPNGLLPGSGPPETAYSPAGTCDEATGRVIDQSANRAVCNSTLAQLNSDPHTGGNLFWACPQGGCPYYTVIATGYTPTATPDICDEAYPTYSQSYPSSLPTFQDANDSSDFACLHTSGAPQEGADRLAWWGNAAVVGANEYAVGFPPDPTLTNIQVTGDNGSGASVTQTVAFPGIGNPADSVFLAPKQSSVTFKANTNGNSCTSVINTGPTPTNPTQATWSIGSTDCCRLGNSGVGAIAFAPASAWCQSHPDTTAFVHESYQEALGRDPQPHEVAGWAQLIHSHGSIVLFAHAFFQSPEFLALNTSDEEFLRILYLVLMDREPDQQGFAALLAELQAGRLTRQHLIDVFHDSEEFGTILPAILPLHLQPLLTPLEATVREWHLRILGRAPDPATLQALVATLRQSCTTTTALSSIRTLLASPEAQPHQTTNGDFLRLLYRVFLERVPDPEGAATFLALLNEGTASRGQLEAQFAASSEFQTILQPRCASL